MSTHSRIKWSLLATSMLMVLVGCGDGAIEVNKLCEEEVRRKAETAGLQVQSTEFEALIKSSDGGIVNGSAKIQTSSGEQSIAFSCVLQGEGSEMSVMRSEFNY